MAKQDYNPTPTVAPSGPPPQQLDVRATPEAFGATIGQSEQKLGGTLEQSGREVFDAAKEIKQQQLATDALNRTTSLSQDIGNIEMKYRQLSGNNATAALPKAQQDITDTVQKYASTIQSPFEQRAFLRDAKTYADRSLLNMGIHAGEEGKKAHVDALTSAIKSEQANVVRYTMTGQDPDYDPLVSKTLMLAHEQGLDKDSAAALVQKTTGQAMHDMVTARIATGDLTGADRVFQDALKRNAPGTDLPLLDADHQANLTREINYQKMLAENRAATAENKRAAVARVGISHEFSAASAIVDNGQSAMTALQGLSDARIDAAYPKNPEIADDIKSRVHDLRQTSTFLSSIEGLSPDQLGKMLSDVPKPDPNDPATYQERLRVSKALTTALQHTAKALSSDPASYVLGHHPEFAPLLDQAMKDPAQFPAYAHAILGSQDAMGVPPEMQHVLPALTAQSFAQKIEQAPETAPATLKAMQQQYGQVWPNVWRDLTQLGKLPSAYQAVGILDNERDASMLARWLGETKKSQKTADDFLGAKAVSDIKTAVRSDPGVMALTQSLARSGSSNDQVAGILTAVDSLAYAKAFYDHDTKAGVNAALSFAGQYEFMPDGGARVPSKLYPAVQQNARLTLDGLKTSDLAVPDLFGKPGMPQADEYADTLKAAPSWITSPSADALWLMDPVGRIVRRKNGDPVSVPFSAPMPKAAMLAPDLGATGGVTP